MYYQLTLDFDDVSSEDESTPKATMIAWGEEIDLPLGNLSTSISGDLIIRVGKRRYKISADRIAKAIEELKKKSEESQPKRIGSGLSGL